MKKLNYYLWIGIFALFSGAILAQQGSRTVTFVNQCPFPVWFGSIPGGAPNTTGQGGACTSDANCVQGATCVTSKGQCFWLQPDLTNSQNQPINHQLAPNGGSVVINVPSYVTGAGSIWDGVFAASTGCVPGTQCQTGDCSRTTLNGPCNPNKGFIPPTTEAEMTFNNQTTDTYDVEINNGVNIPVEFKPNVATSGILQTSQQQPYNCTNPGGTVPMNSNLGVSSWSFKPPSPQWAYTMVALTNGSTACSAYNTCPGNLVCGLTASPMQKICGKQIGWWTAMQVCGNDPNFGAPFNCANTNVGLAGQTYSNLYQCNKANGTNYGFDHSCYSNGAVNTCCGCANWNQVTWKGHNIAVPSQYTTQCVAQNPIWQNLNIPTPGNLNGGSLSWLKQAAPTVYVFPFDDPSSTFNCTNQANQQAVNTTNYIVTFCPGGKTGLPPSGPVGLKNN